MCWGKKSPKPSESEAGTGPAGCAKAPCSPVVCRFSILGPADVPGLSKYTYKIDVPAGKTPTNISWTADKATAGFEGGANAIEATVTFQNTKADWIKLKATFKLDGADECAEKQVALVKVEVGAATFTNPGKPTGVSTGTKIFLVNPPAPPAVPTWVVTNDPGSDVAKFTYNGTQQAAEPRKFVDSQGAGGPAYKAQATLKLISPAEKPAALQKIQLGFIQHGSDTGSSNYATTPAGGRRTVTTPTANTVDWLSSPDTAGPTDEWPWYDSSARATGSGSGTWTSTLSMTDSPGLSIPAQHDPNNAADPNSTKPITTAAETFSFIIRIAARTLHPDLGADKHYFDQANSTWTVNYAWPVIPGVSIVTTGPAWTTPGGPTEVSVNVVPTSKNHNAPFLRWIP